MEADRTAEPHLFLPILKGEKQMWLHLQGYKAIGQPMATLY